MNFKLRIIYEDNHLLVVDKPCGLLVQSDETGDETLTDYAIEYIRKKYKKTGNVFCHPCHRLDRPVGGLVTFARTSKALQRMNKLFRENEVEKTYLAIVKGTPELSEVRIVHWLVKDRQKNITKAYNKPKGEAKRASLYYKLLASHGNVSLLVIKPTTGRPHQIRVQMKMNNTPIRGDLKYGYPKAKQDKSVDLYGYGLSFIHPVKKKNVQFYSKPDWQDFKLFINELD